MMGFVAGQMRGVTQPAGDFPVVRSAGAYSSVGQQSVITVPVNAQAGDMVIIELVSRISSNTPFTLSNGVWNLLGGSYIRPNSALISYCWWRVVDADVQDVTITAPAATNMACSVTVIAAATHAAEIEGATRISDTRIPPPLSPSWGIAETLWLSTLAYSNGTTVVSYPLPNNQFSARSSATTGGALSGVCSISLRTADLNPDLIWGLSSSGASFVVRTIAVRPA